MAIDGLYAKNYSNWITQETSIDPITKSFIEFYAIGTPAYKLSWKGKNLYSYYGYQQLQDYLDLFKKICEGLDHTIFASTYGELKAYLLKNRSLCFSSAPTEVIEAICIYVGDYKENEFFKDYFSSLTVTSKGKSNSERQKKADDNKVISYINRLFYHIRNSFAHGGYTILENEQESYYVFQDVGHNDIISARIIVSETRLNDWMETLKKHRISVLETEVSQCPA